MPEKLNVEHGFSLIELLVALAIGGILLAVGLPSFQDFIAHSKMSETNNNLVHSIQLARSASMERLERAGVCVSDAPMAAEAVCKVGGDYQEGWLVYIDADSDGIRDVGEDILERVEAPGDAFVFTPSAALVQQIYFNDDGSSINNAGIPISGTIGINYSNGLQVRNITVSANGRVSTETP